LLEIFRNVREVPGPVFVHALTVKGKGYQVAEDDARTWHGVVPFDVEAAEMAKSAGPITYTQAFGEVALECAQEDRDVVAITAAMPDGTGLTQFSKEFPDRYFDTGIAEQHAVTFAAGLAAGGLKPFCTIYSTFLQRGYDQVLHDVAIQNLPVRFFLDRAGLVGDDGPTHHGAFDLSYLTHIPNMVVAAPRDTTELKEMARFARGYSDHPIAIRYPRGVGDATLPEARSIIQEGKGEVLAESDQASVTLVAIGSMVSVAWDVRRKLLEQGIEANVINARFAKPLDLDLIETEARRVPYVMTLEENVIIGGFGQQVLAGLAERGIPDLHVEIVALPDAYVDHGTQPLIRKDAGIDADSIIARILHKLAPDSAMSRT
jgi:1-deoxy-D-xylulose-5-phosphate synthase